MKQWNQQPPFHLQTKQDIQFDESSNLLVEHSLNRPTPELYSQATDLLEQFLSHHPSLCNHPSQFKGIRLTALLLTLRKGKPLNAQIAKELSKAFHLREYEVRGFRSNKLTSIKQLVKNYHQSANSILKSMIHHLQDQFIQEMSCYQLSNLTPDRLIGMEQQFLAVLSRKTAKISPALASPSETFQHSKSSIGWS